MVGHFKLFSTHRKITIYDDGDQYRLKRDSLVHLYYITEYAALFLFGTDRKNTNKTFSITEQTRAVTTGSALTKTTRLFIMHSEQKQRPRNVGNWHDTVVELMQLLFPMFALTNRVSALALAARWSYFATVEKLS